MDQFGLGLTPEMFLGKPTLHIPINLIIQDMGDGKVIGVFQTTQGDALRMGSTKTHQLMMADAYIRPQMVMESNNFRGSGLGYLCTDGFVDHNKWIEGDAGLLFKR